MAAIEPLLAFVTGSPALAPVLAQTGLATAAPEVLAGALFGVAVLLLLVTRSVLGALLRPKSLPPMVACLPVVGGFIKFLKVRRLPAPLAGSPTAGAVLRRGCRLPRPARRDSPTRRPRCVRRRGRCR